MPKLNDAREMEFQEEITEMQVLTFRANLAISLKAGAKLAALMSEMADQWHRVQAAWDHLNPPNSSQRLATT